MNTELCSSCRPFGYCTAQKLIEEARQLVPVDLTENQFTTLYKYISRDAMGRNACKLVKDLQTYLGEVKED